MVPTVAGALANGVASGVNTVPFTLISMSFRSITPSTLLTIVPKKDMVPPGFAVWFGASRFDADDVGESPAGDR